MEASLLLVGIVGNVISVLVFASPINTFRRIVRNRSTEEFEPSPYVITLLNSSLWVYYGITKPGGLLIVTVNGVGVVVEAVYVALFLLYAAPPLKAKTAVLVAALDVGFFGAVALVTRLAVRGSSRVVVIGLVCAFLNVLMYGSPLCAMIQRSLLPALLKIASLMLSNTFRRIVRNRSTEEFEPSPYVITLLNSSLWVYYGITKPGGLLIVTVNGVGVVVEAVYVALFLLYAAPPLKAKTAVLVAALDVGFFGAVALVTRLAVRGSSRVVVIGLVCAFLNVLMYGSPLCAMRSVITRRSVEYMPFLLSFFLFLNGGIWTLYAIVDKDIFIGIPNGIGFVPGTSQLILYMIYMNSAASNLSEESYQESQQQRLIVANNEANIQRSGTYK
ncbi:hypothetical protein C4D60_Mb11t05100 [Musa balbisiana]|uniref:Bidirectional sugar transporter SWEET n=1 Tax=Musa balbisiana TaxID=52838 RepID=A0A4S8J1U4_MUSBA|nr:hypothetical protein C4D60_Mb11t05100 [Musa balbisiana]